ncbi:hypothetical protein [Pseudoalteromonas luteoviolacea]|uniref:DUF3352 domain-containing protein n=1 Tax=Pseudoalteromonas luteoviolacea DSM 6061 TaxID=1365250 RepID=A0A166U980_9GAMM|nr:hypothetical protein [Pseudoalteromonas luteoviolacea]KZN29690.1 hypothetical protein N475_05175 [Pseudoalteromonas luteoviolacea DSM 6061]MBE0389420.1 hypothetical protein [Pseudoalteromonas luteoviolacea DSM 6061]
MKKLLLATVTGAAIASGAYVVSQQEKGYTSLPQLDYVPADSIFFWSQLESLPYLSYLDVLPEAFKNTYQVNVFMEEMKAQEAELDKSALFFLNLVEQYAKSLESSTSFANIWGADNELKMLAYSVGLLPVMRAELGNVNAFQKTLTEAADKAGIAYQQSDVDGIPVTKFTIDHEGQKVFDLVLSVQGKWVTLTADTPFNSPEDLQVALAITKPVNSLSSTGKVERYIKDYQLDGASLGYLDNKLLVDALTAKDPQSSTTKMLDNILALSGSPNALDMVRNEACQKDFSDMANKWPAVISGTKSFDISANQANFEVSTIVASTDQKILTAISNLRGFVPAHTQNADKGLVTFGLGLNAAQLSPTVNTIWAAFSSAEFSCQPLLMAQAQSKETNPAMLAMATGMLGSMQGVSFSIFDIDIAEKADQPGAVELSKLDGLATISANDATALFNMAKSFSPEFSSINLPEDGTPVEVNDFLPPDYQLDKPLYFALKGQHIALYTGEEAEKHANALASQAVEANGMITFGLDTKQLVPLIEKGSKLAGEEVPEELHNLFGDGYQMHMVFDANNQGLTTDVKINIKKGS